jgi:hypothetical protein
MLEHHGPISDEETLLQIQLILALKSRHLLFQGKVTFAGIHSYSLNKRMEASE